MFQAETHAKRGCRDSLTFLRQRYRQVRRSTRHSCGPMKFLPDPIPGFGPITPNLGLRGTGMSRGTNVS